MDTPSAITDQDGVRELPQIQGDVVFDKVTFSYDGTAKILNQVSFHINPGETIALVGPTGAGKTTIVNLISRFYDIQEGHVYIDGYDVREVSIESLRHQMGIMTQDNFLFSGTIKDNIRYGKLDATDEEIIAAAKAVNAHDFIMKLDKGYDTLLSERGGGLSIGQKQLLAFARTMVSDPRILILDEATSSIDTKTELLVQSGICLLYTSRPAPMFRCPTSEFPICPSGSPTAIPLAFPFTKGYSAISLSMTGVFASATAFPSFLSFRP